MKIQSLLAPLFPEVERPLGPDDSPASVAGWDSLRQVEIVLAVEEGFGIVLSTQEIAALTSVAALAGLLRRRGLPVDA